MVGVIVKLFLLIFICVVCVLLVSKFTSRWLNVEKKKIFSYNHVNDTHKKIDRIIRITFIIFLFIGLFINFGRDPLRPIWFLEPHIMIFALIMVTEIVTIIMEKRYAENKNDYIFSTIQLVVVSIFILLAYFLVLKDL